MSGYGSFSPFIDRVGASLSRNQSSYLAVDAAFNSATWNTVATHEILTVTGTARIILLPEVTGSITSGGTPGMTLGDETTKNSLIATADVTGLATGEWWLDTTLTRTLAAKALWLDFVIANGKDVGYEITAAALTGGSVRFHAWWEPISSGALVAAGAGGAL